MVDDPERTLPTRYIPLETLVRRDTTEAVLGREAFGRVLVEGSYDTVHRELDAVLFAERAEGRFLVFPESCLGMARFYTIPMQGLYVAFAPQSDAVISESTALVPPRERSHQRYALPQGLRLRSGSGNRLPQDAVVDMALLIPDPAVMRSLELSMSSEHYARLEELYGKMSTRRDGSPILGYLHIWYVADSHPLGLESFFDKDVEVTLNGVRLLPNQRMDLRDRDILRIGPSIVCGYYRKDLKH